MRKPKSKNSIASPASSIRTPTQIKRKNIKKIIETKKKFYLLVLLNYDPYYKQNDGTTNDPIHPCD
jgi:hypothetical protein